MKQFNEKGYLIIKGKALTPWAVVKIKTLDQIKQFDAENDTRLAEEINVPAIEGLRMLVHTPYEKEFPYVRYCAAGALWFSPDLIDEVVGTPEEVVNYDLPRMERI